MIPPNGFWLAYARKTVPAGNRSFCKFNGGEEFNPQVSPRAGETWAFSSTVACLMYSDNEGGPDNPFAIIGPGPTTVQFSSDIDNVKCSDRSNLAPNGTGWALAWRIS